MDIDSLYDSIYQDQSTKDPNEFLSQIEPNISALTSFTINDKEENKKATRLISDYGLMLFKTGNYGKAIPWLNKGIQLFENDDSLRDTNLLEEPMYEALFASRAVCMYSFRRISKALNGFKNLVLIAPENENYKEWLRKSYGRYYRQITLPFYLLVVAGIVLSLIIGEAKGYLNITSMVLIVIGLIGSSILEIIKRKKINAA